VLLIKYESFGHTIGWTFSCKYFLRWISCKPPSKEHFSIGEPGSYNADGYILCIRISIKIITHTSKITFYVNKRGTSGVRNTVQGTVMAEADLSGHDSPNSVRVTFGFK